MDIQDGSNFDIVRDGRTFRIHAWTDYDYEPPAFTVDVWCKSEHLLCGLEGHDCCGAEADEEHLNLSCWHAHVDWASAEMWDAAERGDWEAYVNALINEHLRHTKKGPEGP